MRAANEQRLTILTAPDKQSRLINDPNPGHFSLVRAYHLADFITLMNGFCGIMSIMSSMRYCLTPSHTQHLWAALALMPFGLFFDFFDGKVARWRKKSSLMGQELDSLADLVQHIPLVGYESQSKANTTYRSHSAWHPQCVLSPLACAPVSISSS